MIAVLVGGGFSVPVISHDVAFVKLEQKYYEAMNRVATLSEEKEDLEHLTVQLQVETETVGESTERERSLASI